MAYPGMSSRPYATQVGGAQPNRLQQPPPAYETIARPSAGTPTGGYGTAAQQQAQAEVSN